MFATCRHNIFNQSSLGSSSVVIWKLSSLLLSSVGGRTTKAKALWQSKVNKKERQGVKTKHNHFAYSSGGSFQLTLSRRESQKQYDLLILSVFTRQLLHHLQEHLSSVHILQQDTAHQPLVQQLSRQVICVL